LPANWPSLDDPYYVPKTLGISAFFGALVIGTFMVPIGILMPNPIVAITVIVGLWLLLIIVQTIGWYRYFFRVRPSQARLKIAKAEAEAAQVRLAEMKVACAAEQKIREAALEDYQQAFDEGREALEALRRRAHTLADRKRHLRAMQDFAQAQRRSSDEPDLATRFRFQADAMRRETQHIRSIKFSF
jgi:hypothetical protein